MNEISISPGGKSPEGTAAFQSIERYVANFSHDDIASQISFQVSELKKNQETVMEWYCYTQCYVSAICGSSQKRVP